MSKERVREAPYLMKEKQLIPLWMEAREVFPDWLVGWAGYIDEHQIANLISGTAPGMPLPPTTCLLENKCVTCIKIHEY